MVPPCVRPWHASVGVRAFQVLFCFENSGRRYLSNDNEEEGPQPGGPRRHEVHCAPKPFAWRLRLYDDPTIDPSRIRAGNCVLLYHNETDGFLTAELASPMADVYMVCDLHPLELGQFCVSVSVEVFSVGVCVSGFFAFGCAGVCG